MEDKNIALLGFISSAADYLKNQVVDEQETSDLKDIDLNQFKDELAAKFSSSFESVKGSTDDLMSVGKKAFDDFINKKKPTMIEEFDNLFNIDFKKQNEEKDNEVTRRLLQLLSEPVQLEKPVIKIEIVEENEDVSDVKEVSLEEEKFIEEEIPSVEEDSLKEEACIEEEITNVQEDAVNEDVSDIKEVSLEEEVTDTEEDSINEEISDVEEVVSNKEVLEAEEASNVEQSLTKEEVLSQEELIKKLVDEAVKKQLELIKEEKEETIVEETPDIEFDEAKFEENKEELSELFDEVVKTQIEFAKHNEIIDEVIKNNIPKETYEDKSEIVEIEESFDDIVNEAKEIIEQQIHEEVVIEETEVANNEPEVAKEEIEEVVDNDEQDENFVDEIFKNQMALANQRNVIDDLVEKNEEENKKAIANISYEDKGEISDFVSNFEEIVETVEEIVGEVVEQIVVNDEPKVIVSDELEAVLNDKPIDEELIDETIRNQMLLAKEADAIHEVVARLEEVTKESELIAEENEAIEEQFNELDEFTQNVDDKEQISYEAALNDEVVDEYVRIIAGNVLKNEEDTLAIKEAQEEMDDVFLEIINHEEDIPADYKPLSEELAEFKNQEIVDDSYVGQLMNDDLLNDQIDDKIEENISKNQKEQEELCEKISSVYPYLSNSFINSVYALKEQISIEYDKYEDIILLHRIKFTDVEKLRKFVELVMEHDYLINADENKMIVDTFKQHKNSDGKILTDIFEIANQAKLLSGDYEGYRVITQEDDI